MTRPRLRFGPLALGLLVVGVGALAALLLLFNEGDDGLDSSARLQAAPDSEAVLPDPSGPFRASNAEPLSNPAMAEEAEPTNPVMPHPPPGQLVTFSGRVLNSEGLPLSGALVIVLPNWKTFDSQAGDARLLRRPSSLEEWEPNSQGVLLSVVSNISGAFETAVRLTPEVRQYDQPLPCYPQLIILLAGYEANIIRCKAFTQSIGSINVGDVVLQEASPLLGRVLSEDGKPASNVVVVPISWRTSAGSREELSAAVSNLLAVRTDEAGSFRFDSLPEGQGNLRFLSAAWCPTDEPFINPQEVPEREIIVARGSAVHGLVTEANGSVIESARVRFLANAPAGISKTPESIHLAIMTSDEVSNASSVMTNSAGEFLYECLTASTTTVLVTREGYEPAIATPRYSQGELRITLIPQGNAFVSVIDAQSRQLIDGATVRAWRYVVGPNGGMLDPRRAREIELPIKGISAGGNKTHAVADVCASGLVVSAEARSYSSNVRIVSPLATDGSAVIEVPLHAEGVIAGTVKDLAGKSIEGVGIDASFRPLAVFDSGDVRDPALADAPSSDLTPDEARYLAEVLPSKTATTDSSGGFVVHGLRSGSWALQPYLDGYVGVHPTHVDVAAGRTERCDIVMAKAGAIEGIVLRSDNRPYRDAYVALRRVTPPPNDQEGFGSAYSDGAGAFRFSGLVGGVYELNPVQLGESAQVSIDGGETAQVTLRQWAEASIAGTVQGGTGPIPGVAVVLELGTVSFAPAAQAITDERGRYSLKGPWQGQYKLKCGPIAGVMLAPQAVTLLPADHVTVDFWLGGCTLDCRAISAETGESVVPCRARLRLADREFGPFVGADETGAVRFANLSPGTYVAQVATDVVEAHPETYYLPTESPPVVVKEPCEANAITVPLERSATVRGKIVSSVGKSLPKDLRVSVARMEGDPKYTRWGSPVEDAFFFGSLRPGRHSVAVVSGSEIIWQEDVLLERGVEREVTAVLED